MFLSILLILINYICFNYDLGTNVAIILPSRDKVVQWYPPANVQSNLVFDPFPVSFSPHK